MLAAGHTVKSIAVQLDRSEASINERLRDARRKTSVGSSRELARLLDTQKIWDKNIDLAGDDSRNDDLHQPRPGGRKLPKGIIMMLVATPLFAAALITMSDSPTQSAEAQSAADIAPQAQSPLIGEWSLDVARIPVNERPQRVTIAFRPTPDRKWAIHIEMVGPDGISRHADSTGAADGVAVPVSGTMNFIDSTALRQPGPNTLVMTLGKNGAPVSTRVYTVSKDRKTMTETIIWASEGLPGLETTTFNRID